MHIALLIMYTCCSVLLGLLIRSLFCLRQDYLHYLFLLISPVILYSLIDFISQVCQILLAATENSELLLAIDEDHEGWCALDAQIYSHIHVVPEVDVPEDGVRIVVNNELLEVGRDFSARYACLITEV